MCPHHSDRDRDRTCTVVKPIFSSRFPSHQTPSASASASHPSCHITIYRQPNLSRRASEAFASTSCVRARHHNPVLYCSRACCMQANDPTEHVRLPAKRLIRCASGCARTAKCLCAGDRLIDCSKERHDMGAGVGDLPLLIFTIYL